MNTNQEYDPEVQALAAKIALLPPDKRAQVQALIIGMASALKAGGKRAAAARQYTEELARGLDEGRPASDFLPAPEFEQID